MVADNRHPAAIIDGEHVVLDETIDVLDPATGQVCGTIPRGGASEIDAAVDAARRAYDREWRRTSPKQRGDLLRRLSGLILENADELALLESLDTGKPLTQARTDVAVVARYFDFYASVGEALEGSTIAAAADAHAYTRHEPYGVTGHIVPWNYPLQITGRSVAPSLAAGNCCVLKPGEEASLGPIQIGRLALEAGFPAGVLNVVPGYGHEAGAALSAHPGIGYISFTGSRPVGTLVAQAAAENIVPVALELGGKSPNVVFADANLELAIPTIVNSVLQNAGQTCVAGSRLLVHESRYDEVVDAVHARFREARLGRGHDDPDVGPLISAKQRDRVADLVSNGAGGAELIHGGKPAVLDGLEGGFFFEPTIFGGTPADAPLSQQEVFGPVVVASSFSSDEEALTRANDTEFGLVSAVWTSDVSRAHRMADDLQSGMVFVNSYGAGGGVEVPLGGYKRSGYGREKGAEALLEFCQLKSVVIKY
ncbi:MAG: aldehyde dehydrogenase family protein [Patulibacter sp.]|nr:aldehyde dehydrogenase family protein [Patulibacter sp.]